MQTKEQLVKGAKGYFERNPKRQAIIATSDGQYFWPENQGLAHRYAQQDRVRQLEVHRITREEALPKQKVETKETKADAKGKAGKDATKKDTTPKD